MFSCLVYYESELLLNQQVEKINDIYFGIHKLSVSCNKDTLGEFKLKFIGPSSIRTNFNIHFTRNMVNCTVNLCTRVEWIL